MKFFSKLYDLALKWAAHRHAPYYLGGLSFAESSFFPIPPDVMLAPMVLARRDRAWFYAGLTTVASVAGGILGYIIGAYAFDLVVPLLREMKLWSDTGYLRVQDWFREWGFWAIFIAGFSPVPYKVFTIASGVLQMTFLPFLLASAIGRGARFFLVAGVLYAGGERMEQLLRKYIDTIGWLMVLLAVVLYLVVSCSN
ncbi:MAG: DedA family protein [Acidiferrobacterales bacterium]|jgi:membrane protein YqaA with SNARE-associated domain|nr:DedA family protein [Acidiferrobacterales bacterium]